MVTANSLSSQHPIESSDKEDEKMTIDKCPECDSRKLDRDTRRGQVVCQSCGLVIEENLVDWNDRNHTLGESSHCSPTRRRVVGRDRRNRTRIDKRDRQNRRDAAYWRAMLRANEKTNLRANEIVREMEVWGFGAVYIDAALEALLICFTNEFDKGSVKLPRPYHQMRDMKSSDGKDDIYVIRLSMVATLMAINDFCLPLVPYFLWKVVAESLGLERKDCIRHKCHIKRFLQAMYLAHDNIVTRYKEVPQLRLRTQALDAWFDHLRDRLDNLEIERREVLLDGVNDRLLKLGEPRIDHGDDHNPRPDMLTAVVTVIVAEELVIDISKANVACIFYITTGGLNGPLRNWSEAIRSLA